MSFWEYVKAHKWLFILIGAALLIGILLLTIGFWRTLLIVLLLGVAIFLGCLMDKGGPSAVHDFFNGLFHKGQDR